MGIDGEGCCRLANAFNTRTGIPMNTVDLSSGRTSNPSWTGSVG